MCVRSSAKPPKKNVKASEPAEPLARLIERIASETKPTKDEIFLTTEYADSIISRLKSKLLGDVEIIMAGSVARGTQIRGSSDIDIFLQFPKVMEEREMEKKALFIAKRIVDRKNEHFVINYAEHPYLKIIENKSGMSADVVPSFKISDASEIASAVDRTPLHNIFVNDNLTEKQKGDVRALKYLLKQHYIYGAEARIGGFSGYLCELLICSYGSLLKMLKSLSDAKLPVLIRPEIQEVVYGDRGLEFSRRFASNLVVVDPTDPNRNVAAAVSDESFARLVIISRMLLASKNLSSVFFGKKFSDERASASIEGFKRKFSIESCSIVMPVSKISEDTVWPQITKLRKNLEKLVSESISEPILVVQSLYQNVAIITFFLNRAEIGSESVRGPSVFIKDGASSFYLKHSPSEILLLSGERLVSIRKSEIRDLEGFLRWAVKDKKFPFPSHIMKGKSKILKRLPERYAKPVWQEMMRRFLNP